MSVPDDTEVAWFEEVRQGASSEPLSSHDLSEEQVAAARNFFEMECLVRALDSMETIASSEAMAQEYVSACTNRMSWGYANANQRSSPTEDVGRDFWTHVGNEVRFIKNFMRPVLCNWLLESLQGLYRPFPGVERST